MGVLTFSRTRGIGESMREAVRCETPSPSWGSFCPSTHSGIQASLLCLFGYPASLLTTCPWRHFLSSGYQDPGSSAGFSSWTGNALQSQQTLCLWRENGPQTHPGCLWTVRLHSSVAMCVCVHLRTLGFLSNKISDCCKLSLGDGLARQSRGLVVVPDLLRALLQKAQGTVMVIRTVVCRGKKALKQLKQRTQSQQDRDREGRRQHLVS